MGWPKSSSTLEELMHGMDDDLQQRNFKRLGWGPIIQPHLLELGLNRQWQQNSPMGFIMDDQSFFASRFQCALKVAWRLHGPF